MERNKNSFMPPFFLRLNCLFLYLFVIITVSLRPAGENFRFEYLSIEEGLSQNLVFCILQDSIGYMWFGTQDGLNRYDGSGFKNYYYEPDNPKSISHNAVKCLVEDAEKDIWIGTDRGLNHFERETETFRRFFHRSRDLGSLSSNSIACLYNDSEGILWVGTANGLNRLDRQRGSFARYYIEPENHESGGCNNILCIKEDGTGKLLIGTAGGLVVMDKSTGGCELNSHFTGSQVSRIFQDREQNIWIVAGGKGIFRYRGDRESPVSMEELYSFPEDQDLSTVRALCEGPRGRFWYSTYGKKLYILDPLNRSVSLLIPEPTDHHNISDVGIVSLFTSRSGTVWLGTSGRGIGYWNPNQRKFRLYQQGSNSSGLSSRSLRGIYEDGEGILWIGGYSGLDRLDRRTGRVTNFKYNPQVPNSLGSNSIRVILGDPVNPQRFLWLGTEKKGLNRFDKNNGRVTRFKYNPKDPGSLSHDTVNALCFDGSGTLWVGTQRGLNRLDPSTGRFTRFLHDPLDTDTVSDDFITALFLQGESILWVGTYNGGLNRLDIPTGKFHAYAHQPDQSNSISSNYVMSICEDRSGILWLGTGGGGLNRFDRQGERFSYYGVKAGLASNSVYGILEDKDGHLWLSTNRGISEFNPEKETFKNYSSDDGLQSIEFNYLSYFKSQRGEMFFGGINGLNTFFPDQVKENPYIPPVVVTDFQIFNRSVAVPGGEFSHLWGDIQHSGKIAISHKENVFSIEFAALSYLAPERNHYAYRMEGIDKGWIPSGTRRFVTYANLAPGQYVFRAIGSNNDDIWNNEGLSLKITIKPPFWQTWWFRIIAGAILLVLVFGFFQLRTRSIRKRNRVLQGINMKLNNEISERKRAEALKQVVFNIVNAVNTTRNSREFYQLIEQELSRYIDTTNFLIGLIDKKSATLSFPIINNERDHYENVPVADTFSNLVIEKNQSMLLKQEDIKRLTSSGKINKGCTDCKAWLGVPLHINGEVIGILVLQDYEDENAITQSDLELLEFVSHQVAISIRRKQSEEEIRKLTRSLERNPNAIVITDSLGNIEYVNARLRKISGCTSDDLQGQNLKIVLSQKMAPDDWTEILRAVRSGNEWRGEMPILRQNGETSWESVSISPIKDEKDQVTHFLVVKEDITDVKELQQQVIQAQRMESIGNLAGGIAHDFNNLLTIINGHAEMSLLKMEREMTPDQEIQAIMKAGRRAESLTKQLLAFSRKQAYQPIVIDMNKVISGLERMLDRLIGEDIKIETKLDYTIPYIKADPNQVEQIIMNLIFNARDAIMEKNFFSEEKRIIIETCLAVLNETGLTGQTETRPGQFVLISVSDNGVGMNSEQKSKVFEPFYTSKKVGQGTGLGLSTVYGIVKQNRGHIYVDSEPGTGSTFKIYWPTSEEFVLSTEHEIPDNAGLSGSETILLVEDDAAVLQFSSMALKEFGYVVKEASNGKIALKTVIENNIKIDVLVTDIVMPEMSGIELGIAVKKSFPEIRIVFTSGYSNAQQLDLQEIKRGSVLFIQKPYSVYSLVSRIREILDSK